MEQNDKPSRPVHEIRLGSVRAAIWKRENQIGPWYNVTVSRLYKDGDDWRDTTSFNRDDLPLVAKVAEQAFTWIYGLRLGTTPTEQGDQ